MNLFRKLPLIPHITKELNPAVRLLEKRIGIVAVQKITPIEAKHFRSGERLFIRQGTGGVGGAVLAVGAAAEDDVPTDAAGLEGQQGGEDEFRVPTAFAGI